MFKQAFKASLKFDVSLSILKEVKNTISTSSQWHCKRLINTSSKSKWDLLSAVCLERHPIITRPMNEIETNYYNLLKRIEYENSMKSNHELKLEKEKLEKNQSLESNIIDADIVSLQTAQEFEDSCQEELKNFKFAPRITEFDKSNDKTSHMYKLDKTLVLLVEQNVNNIASWIPPQGIRKDGETMRQAAERVLQEFCGTEMTVKFYGNAPIGFHKYKYLKQNNKESDKCGAKFNFCFLQNMAVYTQSKISRGLPDYEREGIKQVNFSPYADNGGSVVALAGDDFCIIAADNRLSTGYSICTREQEKLFPLSDTTVLGCSGCWCDTLSLTRLLSARMQMYEHEHQKKMSTPAVAQMLSAMLYYKRFFPYYVSNVLAGLDENGKGCVYSYDPIGHCERSTYRAGGSAGALLQPLLDNQIGYKNQEGIKPELLTQEKALLVLKDVFISAAERDIYTGDGISIKIITKDGIKSSSFPLRKD